MTMEIQLRYIVCLFLTFSTSLSHVGKRQDILRNLLQNGTGVFYDNRVPPNFDDDFPTEVTVQIYVLNFDSVTEAAMVNIQGQPLGSPGSQGHKQSPIFPSRAAPAYPNINSPKHHSNRNPHGSKRRLEGFEYSLSIFLRQNWTDARLQWSDDDLNHTRLEVGPKLMDQVWSPDLYFVNEKEAVIHDVTVANKMLHIYKNGTIQSSMRISMTLGCDMFLEKYPHDEQICSVSLGSYSYSIENVVFLWHSVPVIIRPFLTLPRFSVQFQTARECQFVFGEGSTFVGTHTCIQGDFHMTRSFGYYIAQVYVPSILIVILSWVSFWIDIDATPARVSLGLLTVLAITTQSTGEKAALPKVSYLKAIDLWMSMCLIFVFAALLEFAYVNVQSRVERRRKETVRVTTTRSKNGTEVDSNIEIVEEENPSTNRRFVFLRDKARVQKARLVDKCSRVIFPVVFLVFNIVYWIYYW